MKLTQASLSNPVALLVAVILAIIFGFVSLDRLPVQLTPEVEKPEITIKTNWRAAAPDEIESEIVEPQEKVLRGLPGMTEMIAKAKRGQAEVSVTFVVGMDMQRALLEVLNRLNRVPFYPEDAEEPVISSVGGNSRAIAWFILKPTNGNPRAIASYQDYVEEVVQTRFERVPGVALSEVRGGREREVRITFDPFRAASLGIQLPKVIGLTGGAKDISGGTADVGKRRYSIRFAGKYSVDELNDMVLEWRNGRPIRLRDVADVKVDLVDRTGFVLQNGDVAMAVNAHRETGVNVLDVMSGLREAVEELQEGPLKRANLSIEQVYDETLYIDRSIALVTSNLLMGVVLAIGILWWFLRRFRATLMVAIAIPVSIITTFILLDVSLRTINVISLAGLAFAVGMVLDAAIVVLENIVRLREEGLSPSEAALKGTTQVWGALFASTVTTVAIFLPVVFLEEEAGQLFADLALTIAIAICFSLVAAVTVLPTAAQQWLGNKTLVDPHRHWWDMITAKVMYLTDTPQRRWTWIGSLIVISILLVVALAPKDDYLPEGNRNLVFAFILPPPGINIDTLETEMAQVIAKRMQPYVDNKEEPHVLNYFFVVFEGGAFMGVRAKDPADTNKLVPLINQVIQGFPDTLAFARRTSLFGGFGSGNSIDMNIQANNIDSVVEAAQAAFGQIRDVLPGSSVRPFPELDLANPELRLIPNERRIAEVGWTRQQLSGVVRGLGDGLYVGDYFDGNQRLDIILRGKDWETPEDLSAIPLATPDAGIVPLGELAHVTRTAGPQEIRRVDRRRTITLQVNPPEDVSLGEAIDILKEKVEPTIINLLPEDGNIVYAGTANKLEVAKGAMVNTFLFAIVILYLLISALFRSFIDSIWVLMTIPLATVGGVIALAILDLVGTQSLDLLTSIGFIILLGLVVNNAILLVLQTRNGEQEGLSRRDAVQAAVRMRLRPILMSTLTSIFGMLPLLLVPGAGAELYRGLAAVIVGGMAVSTLFTLVLLPSLLRLREGVFQKSIN
ncbi:MAG: efflux RND transporter permease subunit [Gammaproteobacteria bacterium]|nr:efflux RND transporter permease subunit [Gammaproteobacteria bacterium]MDH5691912.1 efflux RND transporter permease subunit [Gammaproteobacteria bacterium]